MDEALKDGAPNGVDCFFDNVGGVDASIVINNHMNTFGRISGCGAISVYNDKEPKMIPSIQGSMVFKVCYYQSSSADPTTNFKTTNSEFSRIFLIIRWFLIKDKVTKKQVILIQKIHENLDI